MTEPRSDPDSSSTLLPLPPTLEQGKEEGEGGGERRGFSKSFSARRFLGRWEEEEEEEEGIAAR